MRIISGEKRGFRLRTLEGENTRPTLERVKEGVFSSIQFIIPGAAALDLYAGSGQMGLEALSRGASRCIFIDDNREAVQCIIENSKKSGLFAKSSISCMDAKAFINKCSDKFNLVFLDPPYGNSILEDILQVLPDILAGDAVVMCESEPGAMLPKETECLVLSKQYRYGTVLVSKCCMKNNLQGE